MKICIITLNRTQKDDRLYYKLGRSLKKIASVYIINPTVFSIENDGVIIVGNDTNSKVNNSFWIFKHLTTISPDIIQVTEPLLLPLAVKYKSKYRVKLIYDPAEDWSAMFRDFTRKPVPIPQLLGFGMRQFEKCFLSKMDYFIASDDWLYDYYNSIGPCALIYNYPNQDIFSIDLDSISRKPFSCVYHGQLRKERGLFLMIKAMKLVVEKHSNAYLDLVGHFSYYSEEKLCYKLLKKYGLINNVNISSSIPHLEIPGRIAQSIIGLLPFYNIEKFRHNIGTKMFEYAACKLPIVAFDLPTARKFIVNKQCGLCVQPDSVEALAQGIINLLNDCNNINTMAENGFNAYQKYCYWECQESALFTIYNQLFSNDYIEKKLS